MQTKVDYDLDQNWLDFVPYLPQSSTLLWKRNFFIPIKYNKKFKNQHIFCEWQLFHHTAVTMNRKNANEYWTSTDIIPYIHSRISTVIAQVSTRPKMIVYKYHFLKNLTANRNNRNLRELGTCWYELNFPDVSSSWKQFLVNQNSKFSQLGSQWNEYVSWNMRLKEC